MIPPLSEGHENYSIVPSSMSFSATAASSIKIEVPAA